MDDWTVALFIITLTALIYSALSLHVNRTFGNRKRVKEIQEEMSRINAKLKNIDYKDDARKKEAESEQEKIPKLMSESMILQFKPLIIILPIFALVTHLVRTTFPIFQIRLGFSIPTFPYYWLLLRFNLDSFPNWRNEFGTFGWFLLCVVISGILIQVITDKTDQLRRKR